MPDVRLPRREYLSISGRTDTCPGQALPLRPLGRLPQWSGRRVPGKTTLLRCVAKRSEGGIREMVLTTCREHLADQLQRFPEQPGRSFESYAVTTAALTRTILEYLGIDDLTVPAMHDGTYKLKTASRPDHPLQGRFGRRT